MGRFAIIWVSLGGAFGTAARYSIEIWLSRSQNSVFPAGTFAVNLIGSFLLGLVMIWGRESNVFSPLLLTTLSVGFLGGFTTYSSFSFEAFEYLAEGRITGFGVYVAATLTMCLLGTALGAALGSRLV